MSLTQRNIGGSVLRNSCISQGIDGLDGNNRVRLGREPCGIASCSSPDIQHMRGPSREVFDYRSKDVGRRDTLDGSMKSPFAASSYPFRMFALTTPAAPVRLEPYRRRQVLSSPQAETSSDGFAPRSSQTAGPECCTTGPPTAKGWGVGIPTAPATLARQGYRRCDASGPVRALLRRSFMRKRSGARPPSPLPIRGASRRARSREVAPVLRGHQRHAARLTSGWRVAS